MHGGRHPRNRRPPWRLAGAVFLAGSAACVVGIFFSSAWLIVLGAVLILMAPLLFLVAAPPPPKEPGKHSPYGQALSQLIERSGRTPRD